MVRNLQDLHERAGFIINYMKTKYLVVGGKAIDLETKGETIENCKVYISQNYNIIRRQ